MALLFVVGVMNVLWIALLALLVLLEKLTPWGRWVARIAGAVCIAAGVWMVFSQPNVGSPDARNEIRSPQALRHHQDFTIWPPFMTKPTRSSAVISASGSSLTAMRSA